MSEEYKDNSLWLILVETVENLPMYKSHLNYVKDKILVEKPNITAEELSQRLNMPLGEAIVILSNLSKA